MLVLCSSLVTHEESYWKLIYNHIPDTDTITPVGLISHLQLVTELEPKL